MADPTSISVPNLWNSKLAPTDPVDELVYASNLLGSDPRVTNFGGGNTSVKVPMADPITGEIVPVLWVKASGGDLGSATRSNFASLYLDKVTGIERLYANATQTKSSSPSIQTEDEVVPLYMNCVFGNNPAAPSIDTPLHAFVPAPCVSHMHSDAVIAIAASVNSADLMREIYGDKMGYLPWKRPGFDLGLMLRDLILEQPSICSALMGQHGFINWADTWEECYDMTICQINQAAEFIEKHRTVHAFGEVVRPAADDARQELVAILPKLRGQVAFEGQRLIAHVDSGPEVLDFMSRGKLEKLAGLGTSCPDHFLRTKIRPMILPVEADIAESLHSYREGYRGYYERCQVSDSPAMRNPNPSVVLIPGVGMVSFGKNAQEAKVTGEFYRNAIEVMKGAETVSQYMALPEQEAFNIEYWKLEEAKLRRQPPEKEMSRRIALVVGAGPGIGQSIAERLLDQGACVVVADLQSSLVEQAVERLRNKYGALVVGGEVLDKVDRASVRTALENVVLRFGGLDVLIDIAAVFIPPDVDGRLSDSAWKKTYEINLVGTYILADEAHRIMAEQGLPCNVVLVGSANAVVAKKGSVAYDTSKAAVNHLVRELAIEYSPLVRVNAVAPATVVAGSQMFPRDRVISSLAKYGLEHPDEESDDQLRERLAKFYAKRTLLNQPVSPAKVADAAYLLATDRLAQTTGHVIPVDAGLPEAFLR